MGGGTPAASSPRFVLLNCCGGNDASSCSSSSSRCNPGSNRHQLWCRAHGKLKPRPDAVLADGREREPDGAATAAWAAPTRTACATQQTTQAAAAAAAYATHATCCGAVGRSRSPSPDLIAVPADGRERRSDGASGGMGGTEQGTMRTVVAQHSASTHGSGMAAAHMLHGALGVACPRYSFRQAPPQTFIVIIDQTPANIGAIFQ
eukprot:1140492-Prymnesium_polylepis.1